MTILSVSGGAIKLYCKDCGSLCLLNLLWESSGKYNLGVQCFQGRHFSTFFYVAWWTKMMRGFKTFLNAKYDSNKENPVKRYS